MAVTGPRGPAFDSSAGLLLILGRSVSTSKSTSDGGVIGNNISFGGGIMFLGFTIP